MNGPTCTVCHGATCDVTCDGHLDFVRRSTAYLRREQMFRRAHRKVASCVAAVECGGDIGARVFDLGVSLMRRDALDMVPGDVWPVAKGRRS